MKPRHLRTAMDTCEGKGPCSLEGTIMDQRKRPDESAQTLVSLANAADQLGISVKTLRRRISDGTIHGYRVGRLIREDPEELRRSLIIEMPSVR